MAKKVKPIRISKLQRRMKKEGIEAFLITNLKNLCYLSGFSATAGALLVTAKEQVLMIDFRYLQQAKEEAGEFELIRMKDSLPKALARLLKKMSIKRLCFEGDSVSFYQYQALNVKLKGVEFIPVKGLVEEMRLVKDSSEIAYLQRAVEIVDRAFARIINVLKPGMEEKEVSAEIDYLIRREGADKIAFDTIVASGSRSALPHAKPFRKKIAEGEFILIDMGAVYEGYHSDCCNLMIMSYCNLLEMSYCKAYNVLQKGGHYGEKGHYHDECGGSKEGEHSKPGYRGVNNSEKGC